MKKLFMIIAAIMTATMIFSACSDKSVVYNEAGGFYEQQFDVMIGLSYWVATSGVQEDRIDLIYEDGAEFYCKTSAGSLMDRGVANDKELTVASGRRIYFINYWLVYSEERHDYVDEFLKEEDYPLYIDIVLKVGDRIRGYAVIKVYWNNTEHHEKATVLRSAIIPEKKNGIITEEQINAATEAVKKMQ